MVNKDNALADVKSVQKVYDFSFAKHTTYGLGGLAQVAYFPRTIKQAIGVYDYLYKINKKFLVLGNGSNILVSETGFDGAVISTKQLSGMYRTGENTFFCYSGTTVNKLLNYCRENGFGGLEFLAGIPATCGGLCYMNGGVSGKYVGELITKVKFYDGKMHVFSNKNCRFGNKYSTMRDINCLILGFEFKFEQKSPCEIRHKIEEYIEKRKKLPKGKSCGCVFKNPEHLSAGKIIDECGLKGLSCGGAHVSEKHANFIINSGESSSDVYRLIKTVKQKVYEQTGCRLEEEVVYIGDFNDTFS